MVYARMRHGLWFLRLGGRAMMAAAGRVGKVGGKGREIWGGEERRTEPVEGSLTSGEAAAVLADWVVRFAVFR